MGIEGQYGKPGKTILQMMVGWLVQMFFAEVGCTIQDLQCSKQLVQLCINLLGQGTPIQIGIQFQQTLIGTICRSGSGMGILEFCISPSLNM